MDAYIDLSIIVLIINFLISFYYSTTIINKKKYSAFFIITTILLFVVFAFTTIFLIPYFLIMGFIIYSLILAIFDVKLFLTILLSLFVFYLNNAFLLLIGGCFLYNGMLFVNIPYITWFILIIPLYICILHFLITLFYYILKNAKFKIKCCVEIANKKVKGVGLLDSGNSLLYNGLPVIFINDKPISNEGEIIKIKGINDVSLTYLAFKGLLTAKLRKMEVYVVFTNNKTSFNDCKILLNRLIM